MNDLCPATQESLKSGGFESCPKRGEHCVAHLSNDVLVKKFEIEADIKKFETEAEVALKKN